MSDDTRTAFENLDFEQGDRIATITIDRPKMNALNAATLDELAECVASLYREAEGPRGVRAVVVTGAGTRAFVAGADIKEMRDMREVEARAFSRKGQRALKLLEDAPFATIAAVNGFALGGGCELALACDLIYAAESATFGQPEVNLGVIPGFGGTQRLSRVVGTMMAREMVLTGRMIDAAEALRIGLVARIFPDDELLDTAHEIATQIASKGPLAVRRAKRVMAEGYDTTLDAGLELETEGFAELFATEDQTEGMAAFIEKRTPDFEAH